MTTMSLRYGAPVVALVLASSACSSPAPSAPYAACSDAPLVTIHSETDGVPQQIELHGDTMYWLPAVSDTSAAPSRTIIAYDPSSGGDPKTAMTLDVGISGFWFDGDSLVLLGGDNGVWRGALDGTSAPQRLFSLADHPSAWAKDATALYGVTATLLTTAGSTELSSRIDLVEQPLDGSRSHTLASWTVLTGGLGAILYNDGDAIAGVAGGTLFRVAKSDGTVVAQQAMVAHDISMVYATPPRSEAFYVGFGADPHFGTFALDGTIKSLWPTDLPDFITYEAGVGGDGTAYIGGLALTAPREVHAALAVVPPGGRPSIVECTRDTTWTANQVLVGDDAAYVILTNASSGWGIERVAR